MGGVGWRVRHLTRDAILVAGIMAAAIAIASAQVTYFGLTFPPRVGDAELGPTTDFEKTKPGLGYGVRYQRPGWAINIYIYDDQVGTIPDDTSSEVLTSQLKQAEGDISELERRGDYAKVRLTGTHVMRDDRGRTRFTCADYTFERKDMGKVDSFLCLTGWHNKFVKFRLTTGQHQGSAREAERFMEAWMPGLWPVTH
jgi:hypothetical protein